MGAWLTHLLCNLSWSSDNRYITFGDHCGWQPGLWYGALAFAANIEDHHIQSLTNFVDTHDPDSTLYLDSITNYSIQWSNSDDDIFMGYTRVEVKPDGRRYSGILIVDTADYSFTTANGALSQIGASAVWSPNGQYVVGLINSDTQESILSGTTLLAGAWNSQHGTVLSISDQLPKGSYDQREIFWSPDSRSFAYMLTESTNNEGGIAVVTLPDGPVTSILGSIEGDFRPIGWISADDIQP